jgi:transcriptional repressor NrdR
MERPEGAFQVVKKSGEREPFSRAKIERAIELACYKRRISVDQRLAMVDAIEAQLQEEHDLEVESRFIGEKCMDELKKVDQVAYVRFASVYREFKDFKDFVDKLQPILIDRHLRSPEAG